MAILNYKKKRLNYLFAYFFIITTKSDVITNSNNNKTNNSIKNNNKTNNSTYSNKVLTISGQIIDKSFFDGFSTKYKNVEIIIFNNCEIKTNLDLLSYSFILTNNSTITKRYKKNSKFIHIKKSEVIFYNLTLEMDYEEIFNIIPEEIKNTQIEKVILDHMLLSNEEKIKHFFTKIQELHTKKPFKKFVIKDVSISNSRERILSLQLLKEFMNKTGVILEEESETIDVTTSSSYESTQEIAGSTSTNNNKINISKEKLEKELQERSDILSPGTIKQILDSYDEIQKKSKNNMDTQTQALIKFYIDRIEFILKLPKKTNNLRKFKNTQFLKQIMRELFLRKFPAGADQTYQKIEDSIITFYIKGEMKDLPHILLVGAAGTGKTSWVELIAMNFALLASNNEDIPDSLLEKVFNGDEDAVDTLYKILETKSISHMALIKGSTLVDINTVTGVSRAYTSPKVGIIADALKDKIYPVVFFFDEIDKAENYHNRSDKKTNAIHTAILNFFDGTGGNDAYLEVVFMIHNICFSVMTANNTDNISPILKDRFQEVTVEGPTMNDKIIIILMEILRNLKKNNFIRSIKNYTIEKKGSEIIYKIGGGKDDKISINLSDHALKDIIRSTQNSEGLRHLLRYIQTLYNKLYIKESEKQTQGKIPYQINRDTLSDYIDELINFDDDKRKGANIHCIYEDSTGNHKNGEIYILPSKIRGQDPVSILGGGKNNGQNYHLFRDLAAMISGILSNLSSIVDNTISGKFGLSMIKPESTNVILTIPTDGMENTYNNLLLTLVVSIISSLRKIPIKNNVILIGELTPSGQILMNNTIKLKSIIAAITNKPESCNILVLPISVKNNKTFRQYMNRLPSTINVIYVSTLSDVLESVLDINYI